ncbi:MAG: DEAD/DEAH box helicase family protein [Lachnospiraceae bacterium]|nr:DEAD/DEAH box helicase family protein [Lachnospiraceae bacterium]
MVGKIKDYEFQTQCVEYLINKTVDAVSKQVITVKAPTGAGKTVILIKYVDEFLKNTAKNTAFVWLCPGKGNLEEQSKEKMEEMASHIDTRNLMYSMMVGFEQGSVTFINWELVTKKGNTALKDSERSNLFEKIAEAHKDGVEFVVIIDEEHLNNTKKADDIISAFAAKNIIRVSATANKVPHQEYYEISEDDVIGAGLITRAIYVNEGVDERKQIQNDYEYLLDLADDKRKEITEAYIRLEVNVRPLVLIQFPMGQPETIKAVEEKLSDMGYTYDNGMVNIWMSNEKIVSEDLTKLNGAPAFLLMKQAISAGWDCPRAKILVKLREGGNEDFQIQTIGRIRRMPEGKHYGLNILDYCYIYTLDTQYKMGMLSSLDKAYQVRRLFLREEAKDFTLPKEMRDLDFDGLGERETLEKVYDYFKKTYNLSLDKKVNQENLEAGGYNFSHEIDNKILQGIFKTTKDLVHGGSDYQIKIKTAVNTHTHGIYLLHSVDEIKKATGMQSQKVKNILRRMFSKGKKRKYKFIELENADFYAFVINNVKKLKKDFKNVISQMGGQQMTFILHPKTLKFYIPEMEIYKFSEVKNRQLLRMNAYKEYTNEFITNRTRSKPERLFERYCENSDSIEWVYKNGDSGQQYLSIVYTDAFLNQWLFYPDYIVHLKDGTNWIIETKGGEISGHSKNIDMQIGNKFNAFKQYAEKYNLHWGFVRDIDEELYINNTEFINEMSDDRWRPLKEEL